MTRWIFSLVLKHYAFLIRWRLMTYVTRICPVCSEPVEVRDNDAQPIAGCEDHPISILRRWVP